MTFPPRAASLAPMLPIRDHNPSLQTPFVTYALIAINIIIFLSYLPIQDEPRALAAFYHEWGLIPAREPGEAHTFLTSMFLHAGWLHLGGNMLFLWIYGDNLEEEMGHVLFLLFYLASGILAGVIHVLSDAGSPVPTVGASGAIAGVMGGYLLLFPKAKVDVFFFFIVFFRIIPISAWIVLGLWFGFQLFSGVTTSAAEGGVAYWAHIGGFVAGLLLTVPLWLRRGGSDYWEKTHGHPPHPEAKYSRSSIPVVRRK